MWILAVAALLSACLEAQIVFVHANVFDGTRMLRNKTVVVDEGLIKAVGGKAPRLAKAETIDATGKTLMPGLIDSYGDPKEAEAALTFGVTTFAGVNCVHIIYDDGFAWGLRHPPVPFTELHDAIDDAHKEKQLALIEVGSLRESMEAVDADADGLVRIFSGAKSDPVFVKHVIAHKTFIIPVLSMLVGASGLASSAEIAADPRLAPYLSAPAIERLKERVPGRARIDGSFIALHQLRAAHVPILAGDASGTPGTAAGASLHWELELFVRNLQMKPSEALAAATSVPARILHMDDRGVIAAGKRADLILVNGDPTRNILATRDIAGVWKAGVPVERKPR